MKVNDINKIEELCRLYTNLDDGDISVIKQASRMLQTVADIENADAFIDCLTRDPDEAIVVAEAEPSNRKSMYRNTVVGQLALRKNEPAVLRTLELGAATKNLKATTQESITVRQTVAPIKNNGKIVGVLILEKDITDTMIHQKNIKMLSEGYEQFSDTLISLSENEDTVANYIDDAIMIFDEDGIVRFANPRADIFYKTLGYKDNLTGMHYNNLSMGVCTFREIIEEKRYDEMEVKVGNLFLMVRHIPINSKTFKLVVIIKDVTLIKEKEKELISKSVAIKEIHHRVKNNLQTTASLLRLQARRSKSEDTKTALYESMSRILSIAATHELLAQEGIDEVDIFEVISNIKDNTMRYFNMPIKNVEVTVTGDNFKIQSDVSTSVGLVINELLQNSLKYAFPNRNKGKIDINIEMGKIYSTITVTDNGVGFDVNKVNNNSLGLNIVKSTVQDKLKGNISIVSGHSGTIVKFDFKNQI